MPVGDNQNSLTAGPRGPVLMQDFHLIEEDGAFQSGADSRACGPCQGAGAFGTFTVTNDITRFTKAPLFQSWQANGGAGPVLHRRRREGSADSARDPRGFALKFYTEEEVGSGW